MVTSATKKTAPAAPKTATSRVQATPAKPTKKVKVVRDSFSMPQDDYALIAKLKEKALAGGLQVKKSALLRAGLQLLDKSSALQLKRAISGLTPIKTGRSKKH